MEPSHAQHKPMIIIKDKPLIEEGNKNIAKKTIDKNNPWEEYLEGEEDFDLFDPTKMDDLDLRLKKDKKMVFVEESSSQKKLKSLKQWGEVFEDDEFPSNDSSLYGPYPKNPHWKDIKWEPLTKHFPKGKIFINDTVAPRDIRQGFLGDCYFLAGLAALSESPHRITELFMLETINEQKYFSVKILYHGKWVKVDLDQMVPFMMKRPAFSDSVDGGLWVILLEKAWAKLYKSYQQIQAGFAEQVLHDLTGAPVSHILFTSKKFNKDQAWQSLLQGSKKNYAMVCCSNPGSDTQKSPRGIVQGHAYTFLNATQINAFNQTQRIVKIRNPWGAVQFNGKWSDQDPLWNNIPPSEKNRVQFEPQIDDGTFFMSYDDFLSEFMYIEIAEINDNASYIYESYRDEEMKGVYFTIKVLFEGQYSLQLDMTPQRSFTGDKQAQYKYPQGSAVLKRIENNKAIKTIIDVKGKKKRTLSKKQHLKPGKYVAFIKIDWDPQFEQDYIVNLACYSSSPCGIYIASFEDAIAFTGDPNTAWVGQHFKYLFKKRLDQIINSKDPYKIPEKYQDKKKKQQDQKKTDFLGVLDHLVKEKDTEKKEKNIQQDEKEQKKQREIGEQEKEQRRKEKQRQKQKERERQKQRENQRKQREQRERKQKERQQREKEQEKEKKRKQDNKKGGKKKVLKTREVTKITQTSRTHNKDPQTKTTYTIEKRTQDFNEKITQEYRQRKHLKEKVTQNKIITQKEGILQNGEEVHVKTSVWQEKTISKEDKTGKIKKSTKERQYKDEVMYEDEDQSEDFWGVQDDQRFEEIENGSYNGNQVQEKKSVMIQRENTGITTPIKKSESDLKEFSNYQTAIIQKYVSDSNHGSINPQTCFDQLQNNAANKISHDIRNSEEFKRKNLLLMPEEDQD